MADWRGILSYLFLSFIFRRSMDTLKTVFAELNCQEENIWAMNRGTDTDNTIQ